MKSLITYIFALLLIVGCDNNLDDNMLLFAEGEGGVELSIELPSTKALSADDSASILTNSALKIYSVNDSDETTLVRRYEPATEMPDVMYLAAGEYFATLSVGDETIFVTSDTNDLCYYGECSIDIVEGQSSATTIICSMRNSIVEVAFDDSIAANFTDGYSLSVVASGESVFSDTIYSEGDLKAEFLESGSLYFLIDSDDDSIPYLLWQFKGQREIEGILIDATPITINGKVTAPSSQEKSLLTFKYSNYLEFSSELITVDYSLEEHDDVLHFSPQPSISSDGFALTDILSASESYSFTVRGLNPLTYVEVSVDGTMVSSGYTFTIDSTDNTTGYLTLSSDLFSSITAGNSSVIKISAYDEDYGEGTVEVTVANTGVSSISNVDYWLNTAKVSGIVTGSATSVSFDYRVSGSSDEWVACDTATSAGSGLYEATISPTWSGAYSNGSYSLLSGIMAGVTYEIRMTVDGVEYTRSISAGGTQDTITGPEGDEDSSCYGTSSSSSTTWASGNNTFVSGLCSYSSGSSYLQAKNAVGTFATGNLVYGRFTFNGMIKQTGTMNFGQAFNWTSRPKSFKFTYQATIGTCDMIENSGSHPLSTGDTDPARVYFAIVDWSSRHSVTAGSGAPSGTWDPVKGIDEVSEGNIIGYASIFITESTSGFVDEEIEIFYYDKTTKPSKSISIVVSAVTSAYGDYLSGSTSNRLYIKNFGLGY